MLESWHIVLRFSTRLLLASSAVIYSALAPALGLGDITLHSALNQPLKADIALVDAGGLGEGDLSVSLGTTDEFSRAGVERVFFLNNLTFTPILRGNRQLIRVTSSKPVTEPFLNFLVQLSQPNGRLLREYTVLIDPPGAPGIVPATDEPVARPQSSEFPTVEPTSAPPPASQGKRYTVVQGDNPWVIAKRLHDSGSNASASELMQGILALNPGSERLSVGQHLLLPDSAQLPAPSANVAQQVVAPEADAMAEQLATSVLQNQQLQKTVDELNVKVRAQDEQIADARKQVSDLQARLAEVRPPAPAPVLSVAPVSAPAVAQEPQESHWLMISGLLALVALLVLGVFVRRQRQRVQVLAEPLPVLPSRHEPVLDREPTPQPANAAPAPAPHRETPAGDVLGGVGIYLAYGRFSEAADLLREACVKEPQRTDLALQLLEVLGKQGDVAAYEAQEAQLREAGFDAQQLHDIRARCPKLQSAAPIAAIAPAVVPPPEVATEDEFQLNLDDLSMDSNWDLVSPFESPAAAVKPLNSPAAPDEPAFTSNLHVLPDVFEMPYESTVDEPELEWVGESEDESLDDSFLEEFGEPAQPLELESLPQALTAPNGAGKLEQAQTYIDDGDLDRAIELLNELLNTDDEPLKQTARNLLAGIR
ncbi:MULTISPECIES: FimV/HubP family polar landmark protein [unclassified Pseudomonas]|uniref:FimV/HubP family polar landmark protein n=1 Tax=unclassified Pseudomonas TaxID=196821 RepID=UPI002AC9E450|nr:MULTISPECIES: FimV/HubP family polar landmark protein [unclassified Pseudomonas]MEB0045506.1 FimV/HubP family polar landmark protein [Pseudomonas sp. Dout3]MEB0097124.1 FimV/HubP family polar landmark protein [Pseudomonas sp. DC1.2]WPX60447.1 FimV/HubP family polar landmark protein [Pseudomonas sp. DC1.2]